MTDTVTDATLDLSKYHKPELYESLDELLAIRQRVVWLGLAVAVAILLGLIVPPLLFWTQEVHWSILAVVAAYGAFFGGFVGLIAAFVRLIDNAFDQVIGVLNLTLEMTVDAAGDVGDLAFG